MEEIDEENIMGRRTRGRNIDFAQAAKNLEEDDEDEEDDDDFVDEDADKMEESIRRRHHPHTHCMVSCCRKSRNRQHA